MLSTKFSSQLCLSLGLLCIGLVYSVYSYEDSDSAIIFENPHDRRPFTVRQIDTRGVEDTELRSCQTGDGPGKCVEFISCPPAVKAVRTHKRHNFKRCGFHGDMEVLCCPTDFIVLVTPRPDNEFQNTTITNTEIRVTPIVDTFEPTESRTGLENRRAVQVCEEYSKEMKPDITFHIIEGEDAAPKEFPHMVALGYNSDTIGVLKWGCGGSLISRSYVLTAAHCIINADQNPPVKAKMGMINVQDSTENSEPQEFDIANITIHPNYKKWDKLNDIALIKLSRRTVDSKYVHPACLYAKEQEPTQMVVTGWGDTEVAGSGSAILQKAALTSVSLRECNVTYLTRANKHVTPTQICAAGNRSDTCQGDSGGPLQVQNIANSTVYSIVGVTSYGIGCGSKYPGIYTRVSSYLDWIENIVWQNL